MSRYRGCAHPPRTPRRRRTDARRGQRPARRGGGSRGSGHTALCVAAASDDPNDDMVLETAVNGHADLIATFDLRHFGAAARRFGIEALLPGACLRRLGL